MSGQYFPGVAKARRRALIARFVVLGVLLAVLVLLAALWPRPEPGGLTVPTSATAVEPAGVLQGRVAAVRRGERACYSVTAGGRTSVLRFVPGWSADDALGLVDPTGAVVAQPGSTVVLLGAPASTGSVEGCTERGRVWTITAVRTPPRR